MNERSSNEKSVSILSSEEIIKKLRESYNLFAEDFANTRKDKEWREVIEYLKSLPVEGMVLDAGCGYNRYGKYLKAKHVCMDFSKNLIKISMKDHPWSMYVIGDITYLPFKNNSFEYSICIATIHHLPSKELRDKALKELIRVSKKGVFLSVWYRYQEKFKNISKDVNVMWRKKYFRYYHLYDFGEMIENVRSIMASYLYKEIFIFIDYFKRNIYVEIIK